MIKLYPDSERHKVDMGWLQSRPSFSFGAYADPDNTAFGVMRVCNDDVLAPGRGFGAHPHSDMEIVSIVLEGSIRHEDNLGHAETTTAGGLQRMSAGTGVVHAEFNPSDSEPLRLLQIWFMPRERGLAPSYEAVRYEEAKLANALLPVASHTASAHVALLNQDMTIYLSRLEPGKQLEYRQPEGRRVYMFIIEGALQVNGTALGNGDSARIEGETHLKLEADQSAFFMLIDLP
ncbi:MAG: quercetin 2,3-dioxygenase [Paenibacillus sp.]|jgi:redox-sensitive bicupin YhaK (pirin superfamily)|nr:quercetin 2,3-dioxygenase [Paenibacillus sp.]